METSKSEACRRDVTGAPTKSSSPASRRTTAGRIFPPGVWWKSIRIRTTSPGRRIMDQHFVDRVIGSVRRLELSPPRRAPSGVVFGDAPLQYDLNLFPRRNLGCDLRRNGNLAVRCEFARKVSRFHFGSLTSLYHLVERVRQCSKSNRTKKAIERKRQLRNWRTYSRVD